MATKKIVKKVKKALKPVVKKKAAPAKKKTIAKKAARYACAVCGLIRDRGQVQRRDPGAQSDLLRQGDEEEINEIGVRPTADGGRQDKKRDWIRV